MRITTIPEKLENWNLEIINKLTTYPDIESETFDFKSEASDLSKHVCAMANTSGGFIVLGVEELKNNLQKPTKFEKKGFQKGKQDDIGLEIGNSTSLIEPTPIVDLNHIEDGDVFYTVIKITNVISKKPFFLRDKGQCYIRIGNSSRPATRTTIMNFFSSSIEQRKNLENLKSSCSQTKESFRYALRDTYGVSDTSTMKIPPMDLSYLRNISLSCEWFLRDKDLWGEHTGQLSYTHGINSILHDLELLNIYIKSYNLATNQKERQSLKSQLSSWSLGSSYEQNTLEMFDKIIDVIDKFFKE